MNLLEVYKVRGEALKTGQDTFKAVRIYLERLNDEELEQNLIAVESRKTKRPKKRENKIKLITARVCQGDAFLSNRF